MDSICINQDDTNEKSVQVGTMGDIYARAEQVIVCIGADDASGQFIRQVPFEMDKRVQNFTGD
jgi:hypothetical protein